MINFPDTLKSNSPKDYSIIHLKEAAGSKTVKTINDLYAISDSILTTDKSNGNDSLGNIWYVEDEHEFYFLEDWDKRKEAAGWRKLSNLNSVQINGVLNATPSGHTNIYSKYGSSIGKAFFNEVNGKTGIVKNTIGSKGFHVIGLKVEKVNNTDTLKIKLDGDLTELKTLVKSESYKENTGKYWFNLYLGSTNNYQFGYITDIDEDNWASINRNYFGENEWKSLKDVTEETFRSWFDSDLTLQNMNALFFTKYPTLGNTVVNVGTSNAIGVGCSASGPGALATGYLTKASGIGAHAEGAQTTAVGTAHAEGVGSVAMSNNSHAEGYYTQAKGYFSHSEGGMTKALAKASHTEGWNTVANEGAVHSFVGGQNNVTNGNTSFTFGFNLKNENCSITNLFGRDSTIKNFDNSFVFSTREYTTIAPSDEERQKFSHTFIVNSGKHDGLDSILIGSTVDNKRVFKTLKENLDENYINKSDKTVEFIDKNYLQTTTKSDGSTGNVQNFSAKNSFIQAEEAFSGSGKSYGIACTGAKGWKIVDLTVDTEKREFTFTLEGDVSKLLTDDNKNNYYSYSLGRSSGSYLLKISSVDGQTLKFKEADFNGTGGEDIDTFRILKEVYDDSRTSGDIKVFFDNLWENDDNAFYCPKKPDLGPTILKNFYAQHAEGGSCRAIGKYSHAEGRDTTADVRYSHAEGSHSFAGGIGSHCEGFFGHSTGYASHCEGASCIASGLASHCEGDNCQAKGYSSHAGGYSSQAYGKQSFAHGYDAHANGDYAVAFGLKATCDDKNGFVWNGTNNNKTYIGKGEGSFCINPKNGAKGFFIGGQSLSDLISSDKKFSADAKADLTTNEGKTDALKQILLLLGMKESNIKTL